MRALRICFFGGRVAGTCSEQCSVLYNLNFLCKFQGEALPALLSEGAVLCKAMILVFSS